MRPMGDIKGEVTTVSVSSENQMVSYVLLLLLYPTCFLRRALSSQFRVSFNCGPYVFCSLGRNVVLSPSFMPCCKPACLKFSSFQSSSVVQVCIEPLKDILKQKCFDSCIFKKISSHWDPLLPFCSPAR